MRFREWEVIAFLLDRQAQYTDGDGITAAIAEFAARVADGTFAADVRDGSLNDLRERSEAMIARRRKAGQ